MAGKHPLEDLAPRHIVAKELFQQRVAGKDVYLDISMIDRFEARFPTITALCEENGVSLKTENSSCPGLSFSDGGNCRRLGRPNID